MVTTQLKGFLKLIKLSGSETVSLNVSKTLNRRVRKYVPNKSLPPRSLLSQSQNIMGYTDPKIFNLKCFLKVLLMGGGSSGVEATTEAAAAATMSTKNFRVSEGDWICPDKKCGNVNFARRTSCNRCGREKTNEAKMMKAGGTEIGKTLAEKSRGLFSANDWQCKTCSNVNWARRSECNMCNTPKYAKLEERTGYGGGFNEGENVEYIEREESDGEYDEFGRKKKKYRGKAVGPASILKEVEDKESEGEEKDEDEDLSKYKLDEDEDEDDADPSKYNLDASEEEDGNKKKSHRSRSKSRSSPSPSFSRSSSHSSSRSRSR
ncbi:uncharacterized protein [Notamacropus eugenii]|uniref:uncharacterized protein n=1 Tax=Notamacropus eugenii TaxID=9315 RepID=UPI003B673086